MENNASTPTKTKSGFLSLISGLFGVYLSFWAIKKIVLYTAVIIKFSNENPNIHARAWGEITVPIFGYILVLIFGLVIIRLSFKKK